MHGLIITRGRPATYRFEWGSTSAYGNSTAVSPELVDGVVSATLDGFSGGEQVFYRLVVTTDAGTSVSSGWSASLPLASPPAFGGATSDSRTTSGIALRSSVSSGGVPTQVHVEWGTDRDGLDRTTSDQAAESGAVSEPIVVALAGLSPGTTYYYRFVAANRAGSAVGATESFTTDSIPDLPGAVDPPTAFVPSPSASPPAGDPPGKSPATAPAAPVLLSQQLSRLSATGATILVQVRTSRSTRIVIEYGKTSTYGSRTSTRALSHDGTLDVDLAGLAPSATYHFRVRISSVAGSTTTGDRTLRTSPRGTGPTRLPVLTGTAAVGSTLTCGESGHPGAGAIQWLRSGRPIARATGTRYRLAPRDLGTAVSCLFTTRAGVGVTHVRTSSVIVTSPS